MCVKKPNRIHVGDMWMFSTQFHWRNRIKMSVIFFFYCCHFFSSKLKLSASRWFKEEEVVVVADLNNKTSKMIINLNVKIGLNCNYPHHYETNQFWLFDDSMSSSNITQLPNTEFFPLDKQFKLYWQWLNKLRGTMCCACGESRKVKKNTNLVREVVDDIVSWFGDRPFVWRCTFCLHFFRIHCANSANEYPPPFEL